MAKQGLDRWLGRLRLTATVVSVVAVCLAVAVLVIALVPGSPVSVAVPAHLLTGWAGLGGAEPGVVADPDGSVVLSVTGSTPVQRLLMLATTLPGLLLIAESARRLAAVLRAAQQDDPFTAATARSLMLLAQIIAFGGVAVWAAAIVAEWALSATVLTGGRAAVDAGQSLGWWLALAFTVAAFSRLVARGVAMRAELDTVI